MADLKVALEDVAQEWSPQTQKNPSQWRWAWIGVLPALLIAGFFAWRAFREPPSAEPLRAVALTTFPGSELRPSFSPDGDHVAFMWDGPKRDNPDIYVQRIGSAGPPLRLTTDPRTDYNPAWSPDGRWIAFLRLTIDKQTQEDGTRFALRTMAPRTVTGSHSEPNSPGGRSLAGPNRLDLLRGDERVGRQERHVFGLSLSDQQAVEGVAMMVGERGHSKSVSVLDRDALGLMHIDFRHGVAFWTKSRTKSDREAIDTEGPPLHA
jgi:hypothetical protein